MRRSRRTEEQDQRRSGQAQVRTSPLSTCRRRTRSGPAVMRTFVPPGRRRCQQTRSDRAAAGRPALGAPRPNERMQDRRGRTLPDGAAPPVKTASRP